MLKDKLDELNNKLATAQGLNQEQINALKLQINRIEAHLDGISQPQKLGKNVQMKQSAQVSG